MTRLMSHAPDGGDAISLSPLSLEARRAVEGMLHWVAREAQFGAWSAVVVQECDYGSLRSISVSGKLFDGKIQEPFSVRGFPSRRTEPGELVRIHFDFIHVVPYLGALTRLLQMALEPFIIGVGQVRTRQTPDGLIILLRDSG